MLSWDNSHCVCIQVSLGFLYIPLLLCSYPGGGNRDQDFVCDICQAIIIAFVKAVEWAFLE